jgi:U32 family peptidase
MKNKKIKIPELLAPAGSLAAGLTAFDYGADAVYAGLPKFNARERTENFSLEEMSKLIAYARKINKKVYLTFNTLIKESELEEVAEQLFEVSCLRPDAVIVQDIGVLRIIREYFPALEIHASTQMGIHNSAGVNFASKLGIKRVILERQISLAELKQIVKNSIIETEVFIHGALCCSISGSCLLSSWLGGWSGNRGKCKQPCRRRYYGDEGNGFFFSTKDLYSLDAIQELKQIGISSLKIEGRLRKPDYVKNVVSAYRMILDTHPNENSGAVLRKARDILSRSLGRKWSTGFRDIDSCRDVIQHKLLGVSGQPYGKVLKTVKTGFSVALTQRIHIGDRIRIQPKSGDEGPTLTITKLSVNGKSTNKAIKGNECFIHCDKEIPKDGIVYKIGESGGDNTARIANLPLLSHNIDLNITVNSKGLCVNINSLPELPAWKKEIAISDAKNRSLTAETIIREFQASNSKEYKAGKIDVSIHGSLFLPASELKKTRREFWNWLIDNISSEQLNQDLLQGLKKFKEIYHNSVPGRKFPTENSVFLHIENNNPIENSITVHSLEDFDSLTDEIMLPNYCFEYDLNNTARKIRAAVKKGHRKFRVTSLYGFELLKNFKDLQISTSFPLPVCNSSAAYEIKNICIKAGFKLNKVQAWVELGKDEVDSLLEKSPAPMEIYTYGRPQLLITRAFVPANNIIADSKGNKFIIIKDNRNGLALLYADKVFNIPAFNGISTFSDLSNAKLDEKNTSTFNYNYKML